MQAEQRAPVLGREHETAVLAAAARDACRGRGRVVWLQGEPGIGKTALVDAVIADARRLGMAVYRAGADESGRAFPLRLFADCLRASPTTSDGPGAELGRLLYGTAERADALDPVLAAVEGTLETVGRLCAERPVLLVLEDLQWADPSSLVTWRRLAAGAVRLPLLLIGTAAPAPRRAEVARLRDAVADGLGEALEIGPLGPAEALALFARGVRAEPGPRLRRLLPEAGGNPLYVEELAGALVRGGLLDSAGGRAELRPDAGDLPRSLGAAVTRRLGFLSAEARGMLRMAALLGNAFDVHRLVVVLGRSAASMADPLDEAHAAGVLTETDDARLTFRHGLIRQALIEELSASLRTALHRQFAQALAEHGAPFDAVATHLLASPGVAEPWVAGWLAGLSERALWAAAEPAAELLTLALDGPAAAGERREILATRLTVVLRLLGRDTPADEVAAELLRTSAHPERRAQAWMCRLRTANRQSRLDDATAIAAGALADTGLPAGYRARIRARSAVVLLKQERRAQAREQAVLALREGEAAGDAVAAGHARHALSHIDVEPAAALAHLDAGLAGLASAGADPEAPSVRIMLVDNRLAQLNNLGRRAEFEATARELPELTRRVGAPRTATTMVAAAMGCYDFGAWDDALAYLDRMPPELPPATTIGRHGLAALICAHREDWSGAERHVTAGGRVPIAAGDTRIYSGYLVAANAMRAEADGDQDRAAELLATWVTAEPGHDAKERYMWLPALVRLALANGDKVLAAAAVTAAEQDADQPGALAMQRAAGGLCRAQLDGDAAAVLRVARVYAEHGWPRMRAVACEEAAVQLAAAGRAEAARAAFNDAVRGYAELGATWDLRRADARLRPLGIRRGARTLDQRPDSGWAALTAAERRVADLVARGRSNPDIAAELFLSPRTVQTHVSRILRKLGHTSRMEIIRDSPR
jgi:DNA-binding CsgD family transcriptional regulator